MNSERAVSVRRMGEQDLDQVLAIAAALKDAPHWKREAYEVALDAGSMPARVALVAESRDMHDLKGFAIASVVLPQAELELIAVAAAEQGRGIGRTLVAAMTKELKVLGVGEVLLEVRASNQSAHGFYRKLGWGETGRRPRYYADPEEDAVQMSMRLGLGFAKADCLG
jgi:[ribosomal protein S18]-alanine N-acetyltransferase